MEQNNIYNLMNQLTQESKSLWRIKKIYTKDAAKSPEIKKLWSNMAKSKEQDIKELKNLIQKHLK